MAKTDKTVQELMKVYDQAGRDCQRAMCEFLHGVMFGLRLIAEQ